MCNSLKFKVKNQVAYVSINLIPYSPLNDEVYKHLSGLMRKLERNDEVNVVVISLVNEKIFDSNDKVNKIINFNENRSTAMKEVLGETYSNIRKFSKPVIGAINGLALGGVFELALACDLRICSDRAKFAFPEINLAVIPGGGGTQHLQKIIGQSKAKELLYFGTMIDAQKAFEINLVNMVVPYEELKTKLEQLAEKLAQRPKESMRVLKEEINIKFK